MVLTREGTEFGLQVRSTLFEALSVQLSAFPRHAA